MAIEIEVGKPLKKIQYQNEFKVLVKFRYSDASEVVMVDAADMFQLKKFIKMLDDCLDAYPEGKGVLDTYNHVENFWLYVETYDSLSHEQQAQLDEMAEGAEIYLEWRIDPDEGDQHQIDSYTLTFFDSNGIEREVEIKK